jgi:hypothetical protein
VTLPTSPPLLHRIAEWWRLATRPRICDICRQGFVDPGDAVRIGGLWAHDTDSCAGAAWERGQW